jgi:hypothetical protein
MRIARLMVHGDVESHLLPVRIDNVHVDLEATALGGLQQEPLGFIENILPVLRGSIRGTLECQRDLVGVVVRGFREPPRKALGHALTRESSPKDYVCVWVVLSCQFGLSCRTCTEVAQLFMAYIAQMCSRDTGITQIGVHVDGQRRRMGYCPIEREWRA